MDIYEEIINDCKPIAEKLQKNFHPHTTIVIEVDQIRVEETVQGEVIEYALD